MQNRSIQIFLQSKQSLPMLYYRQQNSDCWPADLRSHQKQEEIFMSEKKNPLSGFIEDKLIPASQKIADNKYIKCLAGGSMSLMAIILIGAVFNLLNSIGFEWYQNFITSCGLGYLFNLIYNACMNLMSVFIVYSVGYNSANIFEHEELAFNNGFLAEVAFFILMPIGSYTPEGA